MTGDLVADALAPLPQPIKAFLARWFAALAPGELCEVRPLNKRGPLAQRWCPTARDVEIYVDKCAKHRDNIYIGALPRKESKGTEAAVARFVWLWADVDYGTVGHAVPALYATREDALATISTLGIAPSMLVDTGGGFHVWYALATPATRAEWDRAMGALNYALGGDENAMDPPRILRVPGTLNMKGTPRPTHLLIADGPAHDLATFHALPSPPEEQSPNLPAYEAPPPGTAKPTHTRGGDRPFDMANDVRIHDIVAWLGYKMHREGRRIYSACPAHHGHNEGQMVVGGSKGRTRGNTACCFGDCDQKVYTPVDLVVAHRGCSPIEAVNLIADAFGLAHFLAKVLPIRPGIVPPLPAPAPAPTEPDVAAAEPTPTVEGADDWRDRLIYKVGAKGSTTIDHCPANAITILRCDPRWKGCLAWNSLAQGIVTRRPPPWGVDDVAMPDVTSQAGAWMETDATRVQAWMKREYDLNLTPKESYGAALIVAEGARFDPLFDWLSPLGQEWDGEHRIETWLSTYLGAEDNEYHRFIGRAFLISAVARVMRPGCKVDTMIVLEGPQGLRKSQGLKALFGEEYFGDTPLELTDKDRFIGLRGLWCHEMAELDSFGRADAARVKNFLSSPTDNYRPPYAASNIRVPRRLVFAGTVNPASLGYLRDETGNRRIWPVRCGARIDLAAIAADREQLWAEARERYGAGPDAGGMRWWPDTREEHRLCNEEQEERMVGDVWIGRVARWLDGGTGHPAKPVGHRVTISDVLTDAIGLELTKQGRGEASRVGTCLAACGWVQVGRRSSGARERLYGRASEQGDPSAP